MQKGPLWWAGHHVTHHKYADRDGDPHSPHVSGFYYAHIGWFTSDVRYNKIEPTNPVVRDFGKFPELRLLERHYWLPPVALGARHVPAIGGMQWLAWGFLLPTVTLAHATFCINTVNHLFGSRRFQTMDQSRNNVWTAIFAAGEGWHNNHHRYQRAARNGFYWWEFDPTYYVIAIMGWLGLAWDIQVVPERIYREAEAQIAAPPEPDLDPRRSPRTSPGVALASSRVLRRAERNRSARPASVRALGLRARSSSRARGLLVPADRPPSRPSCLSTLRSTNSICPFSERRSSLAQRWTASSTSGSMRSRKALRSAMRARDAATGRSSRC